MKIVHEYPPNIDEIKKKFGELPTTAIFTYGDTIYNPHGWFLDSYIITHEETHEKQQGTDPEGWWKKYLEDDKFRLEQEVEAYKNQYNHFARNKKNEIKQNKFLDIISGHLSSKMYGEIVSKEDAKKLICPK